MNENTFLLMSGNGRLVCAVQGFSGWNSLEALLKSLASCE